MSDLPPPEPTTGAPPARRLWFSVSVTMSILTHVLILAWLLLPRVAALPPPPEPVNVDLVTEQEASSAQAASSSAESSSAEASSEPPSSEAASSAEPSSAEPSSAEPSSAEPSSAEPSSATQPSEASSAAPPASAASAQPRAAAPQPAPRPAGRTIVPVGQTASSQEAASAPADSSGAPSSAAASTESPSALTANGAGEDGAAQAAPDSSSSAEADGPLLPVGGGSLRPATRFYLEDMLSAPQLAQARDAIAKLSPERRIAQTCNIEAVGQATGAGYQADSIIANAFAPPQMAGTSYRVAGGVFRAKGKWRRIAYECALSDDMTEVKSFDFHIGDDVTAQIEARLTSN